MKSWFFDYFKGLFFNFNNRRVREKAGYLTYLTLLTVIPTLAVAFVILSFGGSLEIFQDFVQSYLSDYFVPSVAEGFQDKISGIVRDLAVSNLGWFSILFYLVTGVLSLAETERNIKEIMNLSDGNIFYSNFKNFVLLVFIIPLSIYLFLVFSGFLSYFLPSLVSQIILSFIFVFLLSYLTFEVWVGRLVDSRIVLVISFLCSFLILLATGVLNFYFSFIVPLFPSSAVYGALGGVLGFLVWVYMLWFIVLLSFYTQKR